MKNNNKKVVIGLIFILFIYFFCVLTIYCAKEYLKRKHVFDCDGISITTKSSDINQVKNFNKLPKENKLLSEEFEDVFSVGLEINSYYLPFYNRTPKSAIQQYIQKIKKLHFRTDHSIYISILADSSFACKLLERFPELSDYRIFDWLVFELLFESSKKEYSEIKLDAITNFYSYSHSNFMMDAVLLKHFYFQLEVYLSIQMDEINFNFIKEIEGLIEHFNKIMLNNFFSYVYYEFCSELSIFNPGNIFYLVKVESILNEMYRIAMLDKMSPENIRVLISKSSKIEIESASSDANLYSYCMLFYHFILKKQCFIDAITFLRNTSTVQKEEVFKCELYNSEFV